MIKHRTWTQEEVDLLVSFCNDPEDDSIKDIADFLGRSIDSVNGKLYHMRRKSNYVSTIERRWTEHEDRAVINSKGRLTHEELAEKLNRSKSAVTHRAITLGITNQRLDFTHIGKDIKRLASDGYTRREIADKLSLEYIQVRNYVYRNNIECERSSLKKTKEQKSEHSNFMGYATRRNLWK